MSSSIHLKDNDSNGTIIPQDSISDILQIAGIGSLQDAPDLLVFPHSFSDLIDDLGKLPILTLKDAQYSDGKCVSAKACTGNLMGFVGINNTSVSIHSRFTHKKVNGEVDESSLDYFLYYMLQKVLSINVFKLEHSSSQEDKILDFLLLLFPMMLKKAMAQGLYKEYQRFQHDDDRVRGAIDVNRYIKADIPFRGRISYRTREHSYDNTITQLIRHTIEYIKNHPFGHALLSNDAETLENVRQIVSATPTYNLRDRHRVLNANRRPKVHPYFSNYRELQQLCVRILRFDSLKYGDEKDRIYGVLFDGAWLWEEYLYTILKPLGFKHPENKMQKGSLPMFNDSDAEQKTNRNSRKLYPDFYRDNFILDAKYKHLISGVGREDLYQVVTYMYCTKAKWGGYLYPYEEIVESKSFELAGYGGIICVIPFYVPQQIIKGDNSDLYKNLPEFITRIKKSEDDLKKDIHKKDSS